MFSPFIDYKLTSSIKDDSIRATMLSITNSIDSIIYMGFTGIFSLIANRLMLNRILLLLGLVFFVLFIPFFLASVINAPNVEKSSE